MKNRGTVIDFPQSFHDSFLRVANPLSTFQVFGDKRRPKKKGVMVKHINGILGKSHRWLCLFLFSFLCARGPMIFIDTIRKCGPIVHKPTILRLALIKITFEFFGTNNPQKIPISTRHKLIWNSSEFFSDYGNVFSSEVKSLCIYLPRVVRILS